MRRVVAAFVLGMLTGAIIAPPERLWAAAGPTEDTDACMQAWVADLASRAVRAAPPPQQQSLTWVECAVVYDSERGTRCNSGSSVSVKIRNRCTETIQVRYCLERTDGKWDCGSNSSLGPGEVTTWYTCQGTGRAWRWAAKAGTYVRHPDPSGRR